MLWSKIETRLASGDIANLYIERSRACDISVTLFYDGADYNTELVNLVSHSNRIQRLIIVTEQGEWLENITVPFRHAPAASLDLIHIIASHNNDLSLAASFNCNPSSFHLSLPFVLISMRARNLLRF
jgi:hypothetical protein